MNFKKIITLLMVMVGITGLHAQVVIPSTGGTVFGSGGSVSYTVGEVIYTTIIGTNGSSSQGVQQAIEITTLTKLIEPKGVNIICSAYPNPATAVVKLKVDNYTAIGMQQLSYQLYNLKGELIDSKIIRTNLTSIVMSKLSSTTYLLKVIQGGNEIELFRIIKK